MTITAKSIGTSLAALGIGIAGEFLGLTGVDFCARPVAVASIVFFACTRVSACRLLVANRI